MDQMDNNMENNMQPAGMGQPDGMGDNKGWAIAALVLGILSIVFAWIYVYVGLILGVVGIVVSVKARKLVPSGISTGGFVCSIIGTALSAVLLVCALCVVGVDLAALANM